MNKRLRRKKRVGEFKEVGFVVRGELRAGLSEKELHALVERFLTAVEARHLAFGGDIGESFEGFVTRQPRGSATEEDRAALQAFFTADADVVRHEVEALRDAWYGWG